MTITNYFTNATDITTLMAIPNQQTGGWFWVGMQFMLWIVMWVVMLGFGLEVALVSSAFLSLVIGTFLVYMNLIAWKFLMFYLGIILAMLFYTTWNNRKDTYG